MQKASSFDLKKWLDRVVEEGIRFPLYMMGKPFKAFSDIKYEGVPLPQTRLPCRPALSLC